jgi:excinuclease UvrABC nuclease subunit
MPTHAKWPDNWPFADRPGVYLMFGGKLQLLFVGKTWTLGHRLTAYFCWSAGRGSPCRIIHTGWKTRPMFIATIAVTEWFEAAALEAYLVAKVHPEENYLYASTPDSEYRLSV